MTRSRLPMESLWEFACAFYAQPNVAERCVALQDNNKVNVCLLIALHWLDKRQQPLSDTDLASLIEQARRWTDTVIVPLRTLRRDLKTTIEPSANNALQQAIREKIKEAELMAEKKLLTDIEGWLSAMTSAAASTHKQSTNLDIYLRDLGVEKSTRDYFNTSTQ